MAIKQFQKDMEDVKEAMNMMTSEKSSLNGNTWNKKGILSTWKTELMTWSRMNKVIISGLAI